MKKLGLNSGYIGSDQRLTTNGIVGYNKLLLERKNRRFLPSIGNILLLDIFPATAVFSLRRLRSDYTGAAIKVRRASNNDELNIGFNGKTLDISTLNSFCAGTDGFVTTWYDQQESNNATQATAGSQPKIYDSSAGVVLENGKPALNFDGVDDFLEIADFQTAAYTNMALFSIINATNTVGIRAIFSKYTTIGDNRSFFSSVRDGEWSSNISEDGSGNILRIDSNSNSPSGYNLFTQITNLSESVIGNKIDFYRNGNISNTTVTTSRDITSSFDSISTFNIGSLIGSAFFEGTMQDIIFYDSDQSANRTAIEANINNYYNIY